MINEAFGYTHQQTLDSSLCVIMSMLKEYNFLMNQRNKAISDYKNEDQEEGEEFVTITDFETGKPIKIKKAKSI